MINRQRQDGQKESQDIQQSDNRSALLYGAKDVETVLWMFKLFAARRLAMGFGGLGCIHGFSNTRAHDLLFHEKVQKVALSL